MAFGEVIVLLVEVRTGATLGQRLTFCDWVEQMTSPLGFGYDHMSEFETCTSLAYFVEIYLANVISPVKLTRSHSPVTSFERAAMPSLK